MSEIITITKQNLLDANVCKEGLEYFNSISLNNSVSIEWSPWLALMISCPQYVGGQWGIWLREKELIPQFDFSNLELSECDLTGAMIKNAKFFNCKFHKAELPDVEFIDCNLSYSDFFMANLNNANLSGCNLKICNFTGATFVDADLSGTNLNEAIVYNADLTWAYYPKGELPEGWHRNKQGYLSEDNQFWME